MVAPSHKEVKENSEKYTIDDGEDCDFINSVDFECGESAPTESKRESCAELSREIVDPASRLHNYWRCGFLEK